MPPRTMIVTPEAKSQLAQIVVDKGREETLKDVERVAEQTGLTVQQIRSQLEKNRHNVHRTLSNCAQGIKNG